MRKSSLKILKEEFGQYLIKNNLNIEINEKTQKGTVSYIKEVATFIENSNNINTYFLFDELDILANNFELGKSAYFFNFLISAQIEEKILFDDFIELLKNQTPSEIKDNQDLSNKFHYNLFNSVTENAAICFIKRPSYLVEMLNKIPNEVFLIHSEIIEKVIDISLNTKAFQKINFQTEVYKFIQTNTDNPSQYDHHFNLININEDNNQIKIEETQLETMKLTINVSSLMTFNLNKNYGLTDLGNLIDYLFDSVQRNKNLLNVEHIELIKDNPKKTIMLSDKILNKSFLRSFINYKIESMLSLNELKKATACIGIKQEEVEKFYLENTFSSEAKSNKKMKL